MQKITPFLWYNTEAEEAMNFYISIFAARGQSAKIIALNKNEEDGKVFSVRFELAGQEFHALNGGPHFKFSEAVSLFVNCDTQEEVDWYWEKLSEGGEKGQCGWLKDKYGLSWQIVPKELDEMIGNSDRAKAKKAMNAMLQMTKLSIDDLRRAMES